MAAANGVSSKLDMQLDIIGQQPLMTEIYTPISFVYPISDPSTHPTIIDTLNKGLRQLSQHFPWVAGQVKKTGGADDLRIIAFEETPRLIIKDLRDDPAAPTIEALRKAKFPMRMFDENLIAPRKTLPIGISPDDPSPVLLFQLNFIQGGIIFSVLGQHACMDMTGQDELIRLLSKACRSEDFTEEETKNMNLDRKSLIPLLHNYEVGPELDHQIVRPPSGDAATAPIKASWAFFSFSPQALSELKDEATKTLDHLKDEAPVKFISTDDALSAFIWQSTSRARLPRLEGSESTQFCRAVDVRTQIGAPKNYPGILQNMAYSIATFSEIVNEPLGAVASRLRRELDRETLRRRTQAFVTYLNQHKRGLSVTADANPSTDIMLSSWAKVGCWDYDFGLELGNPESVRRPIFEPFESLMYLMPKRPDGEISAAISLRDEDMENLKGDEKWKKFGKFIG